MTDQPSVSIDNQLNQDLDIYTFQVPSGASASDPSTIYPVFNKVGTVKANSKSTYQPKMPLENLAFKIQQTGLPVATTVTDLIKATDITINSESVNSAKAAFKFYQSYIGSPYSPDSLAVNDIILNMKDVTKLSSDLNAWFKGKGFQFTYEIFNAVTFWADNDLRAWNGLQEKKFYAYQLEAPKPIIPLVLPKEEYGTINVTADGKATFIKDTDPQSPVELTLSRRKLVSANASDTSGIMLPLVVQDLALHDGDEGTFAPFFIGKQDGKDTIAQPYQQVKLAWWVAAYDFVNITFTALNAMLLLHTVVSFAKSLPTLFNSVKNGLKAFLDAVKSDANSVAEGVSSSVSAADAENGDLINVDVDVDVDVDIDVDVDTDVDVDVDIDVDIDIDIDALVVIDVDVDIDIDVDTVVDNVVDTVIDVDTDIDTDIDVNTSALKGLLKKIGTSIWSNKGRIFKAILKNAAIMGAFTGAQKLLELWYKKASLNYAGSQPSAAAPLGILMNYMINPANSVKDRWTTFSYYVEEGADPSHQEYIVGGILSLKNKTADDALKAWRWDPEDEKKAVDAMKAHSDKNSWPKAYETLADYTYKGKTLPVKVSAGVALKFIKALKK